MQHRLEGDAVAGGFALGLALLGVFDALDAQLAPVLAHVAETVGQRYVIVLGIAISTAAIGLTERAIGHLGDAQLEQSEQLTQRFRYGLIALIGCHWGLRVKPNGYAKYIDVELGFKTA